MPCAFLLQAALSAARPAEVFPAAGSLPLGGCCRHFRTCRRVPETHIAIINGPVLGAFATLISVAEACMTAGTFDASRHLKQGLSPIRRAHELVHPSLYCAPPCAGSSRRTPGSRSARRANRSRSSSRAGPSRRAAPTKRRWQLWRAWASPAPPTCRRGSYPWMNSYPDQGVGSCRSSPAEIESIAFSSFTWNVTVSRGQMRRSKRNWERRAHCTSGLAQQTHLAQDSLLSPDVPLLRHAATHQWSWHW